MVNQLFWANYHEHINKEFKELLAAQPLVNVGGTQVDHYKGLASSMATHLVPFMSEKYQPTEFLYGCISLNNQLVPQLFFQFSVLDVKGKNIPSVGNFGAIIKATIPETYVAPYADWKHRLLPLSALTDKDVSASKVFKAKPSWNNLLEAVNGDKSALKAISDQWSSTRVGEFKVSFDSLRIVGTVQLMPYKGHTIMTLESTPGIPADVNKPHYDLKKHHDNMCKIAAHIVAHPQSGQEIGQLYLNQGNAAMMDMMIKQINAATGTTPVQAQPPASEPSREPDRVCDSCKKPLRYIKEYDRWYCNDCKAYAPK